MRENEPGSATSPACARVLPGPRGRSAPARAAARQGRRTSPRGSSGCRRSSPFAVMLYSPSGVDYEIGGADFLRASIGDDPALVEPERARGELLQHGWSCPAATTIPPPARISRARSCTSGGSRDRAPRAPRRGGGSADRPRRRRRTRAAPAFLRVAGDGKVEGVAEAAGRLHARRRPPRLPRGEAGEDTEELRILATVRAPITPAPTESSAPTRPSTRIVPASGASTPAIVRSSVVLPPPLRPTSATASPPPISRSSSRSPHAVVPVRRARIRASVGETSRR